MAKLSLNRDREYGEILPAGEYRGAHFTQDGHYFGQHGEYLFSDEGVTVGAAKAAPVAPSKSSSGDEEEKINLRAWALGHQKAPFFKIKKEMRLAGYNDEDTANADTMIAALIRDGIISQNEIEH